MQKYLSPITGEFLSRSKEARFQAERMPETLRQMRLMFAASVVLNGVFLFSDWRFHGQPHFYVAVPARLAVVAMSIACLLLVRRVSRFSGAEALIAAWQLVAGIGVGVLVSSQSDIALLVVLMLPMIYYLVPPTSFIWRVFAGIACSAAMLTGYLLPDPAHGTTLGLILTLLILNSSLILVTIRSNRSQRLAWIATEITKRTNAELEASQARLQKLFMSVPFPLVVASQDGKRIIMANNAANAFYGADFTEVDTAHIEAVYANLIDHRKLTGKLIGNGRIEEMETRIRIADGSERDILMAATLTDVGGVDTILSAVIDITRRKQVESRLEQLATTDPLTGLVNRAQFFNAAEQRITCTGRDSHGNKMAMLLLDIDHFKQVNDTLGHDAGDVLLKTFAERLRGAVRATDVVARIGGDEFAIILSGLKDDEDVSRALESVMERLREPALYGGRLLECRASVGASIFPAHADNIADLLKDADIALYVAKTDGRDRVRLYEPGMRSVLQQRSSMLNLARTALEEDQVLPYYQPKVAFDSGRIVGFEALLRWRHPSRGIQLPGSIASAFDDADLAVALSDRMIGKVVDDIRVWLDQGIEFGHVGINASAAEFRRDDFADRVLDRLRLAGVSSDRIELEVTETVFLGRGAEYVERALHTLSREGVRIALDDFGTGYASLSHLKQFPVDIIKIDQSFVRDLEDDPDDAAIIRAVVNLGHSLGIGIVAEGVEKLAQAQYLAGLGCDYGQGFLFARPAPAARVKAAVAIHDRGGPWWSGAMPAIKPSAAA